MKGRPAPRAVVCAAAAALALMLGRPALVEASAWAMSPAQLEGLDRGEILVEAEMEGARRGEVRAAVRIGAPPELVFSIMTNCREAIAFVPHMRRCVVLEGAEDRSWELVEHRVDQGWYVPATSYVFRAEYDPPRAVRFRHVRGDLRANDGEWILEALAEGRATRLSYAARVLPRAYVPRWLLTRGLRRDLPRMLEGLRERAEAEAALKDAPPERRVLAPTPLEPGDAP